MEKISTQMSAGKFDTAAKSATVAFKQFPGEIGFANAAGSAYARAGKFSQAVSFFYKASALAPGDLATQENLLRALIQAGRCEKALELIERLLKKRPNLVPLLILKANAEMRLNRIEDVVATTTLALDASPDTAEIYNLRGTAYERVGKNDAAISDFQRNSALAPLDSNPLVNMAEPLTSLHRPEEALAALQQAVKIQPSDMRAHRFLADQLSLMGKIDEAKVAYHRILRANPLDGNTIFQLVLLQTVEENATLMPLLEAALIKPPRKPEELAPLKFSMGNLLFQNGDFEGATTALAQANALKAKIQPFDMKASTNEFESITKLFDNRSSAELKNKATPHPIFVIGQPRSGTTLCEMILSAHPDIAGCGEMETAAKVLEGVLTNGAFDAAILEKSFREDLPPHATQKMAFVDKMPSNYRYVGALIEAFPNAKFVHLARDPRDVALSMWRMPFSTSGMAYTYDLRAMASQANLYQRYMTHWQKQYPDHILTMNYKDLVSDVEAASRELSAFCGIDFVDEMAAPEKNTAMVRTASQVQVRQKVHQRSDGGWRSMQSALRPFIDALDNDLWPGLNNE